MISTNHLFFPITLILFSFILTGRGENSCGGVLETSAGVLNISPVDQNGQTLDLCMWIIKLSVNSRNIRFRLNQIPVSSHLNFYSPEGHVAGQYTIYPTKSLTSADIGGTISINGSTTIVIWTSSPSTVKNEDSKPLLSFTWESQAKTSGQVGELDLVGGINYVEAGEGLFSWIKPGESEQTLLWALNSKSQIPLDLTIETDFEKCELSCDPCLCSYFGVYEVHDNCLQAISTECSRSSNLQVNGVRSHLIALSFVNPEFRRDTNHVTLTWKAGEPEEEVTTKPPLTTTEKPTCSPGFPKSCSEIQNQSGLSSSQSQNCVIYPDGPSGSALEVLCDFQTAGGGWTVIQKRSAGPRTEFSRGWDGYVRGFGSISSNFWIGLENIHTLTVQADQELRIDLEDWEGNKVYAQYSKFLISHATDYYRLVIGGFSGTAGDSMTNPKWSYHIHNGMRFSTKDNDHDNHTSSCAAGYPSGWWFSSCLQSNLNGYYRQEGETFSSASGIIWRSWKDLNYSLAKTEMKVRTIKL